MQAARRPVGGMDAPGLPAVGSFASASAPILLDRQHSSHDVALRRDPPEAESEWPGELEAVLAAVSSAATPTRAAGSSSSLTAADDSAFAATAGVSPSTGGAADGSPKIAARLGNGQPLELSHFVEVGTLASGGFSARVAVVELRGSNSAGSGTTGAASGSGGEQYALKTVRRRTARTSAREGAPAGWAWYLGPARSTFAHLRRQPTRRHPPPAATDGPARAGGHGLERLGAGGRD